MYEPIERRKVYEQIAEQLLAKIGSRELRPGDPLPPERELTESFAVGRSSIREALRMLESQGVIKAAKGGSFVVAEAVNPLNSSLRILFALDAETGVQDLFELRRILDCEATALAAERRTEADLAEMETAISEMEASLKVANDGGAKLFIEADLRFHLTIARAAGNPLLLHAVQAVREVARRALMPIYWIPGSPESAIGEHRDISAAVAARDAERGRNEMLRHLGRVETDVERARLLE